MGFTSAWHWIVVLLVVVIIFGAGKIPRVMGDVAKGIKSFKKGMADDEEIAQAISVIFLFNIAAALIFPTLGGLLHLSDYGFGLFAGTAINDTSSVTAAATVWDAIHHSNALETAPRFGAGFLTVTVPPRGVLVLQPQKRDLGGYDRFKRVP